MYCIAYRKFKAKRNYLEEIVLNEECIDNQGFCFYEQGEQVIHYKYYKKISSRLESGIMESTLNKSIKYADVYLIPERNLMLICGSRYCISSLQNYAVFKKVFYIEKYNLDVKSCLKSYKFMEPEIKQISIENIKVMDISVGKMTLELKNSLDAYKFINQKDFNIAEILMRIKIGLTYIELLIDLNDGELFFDNVDYILKEFLGIENFGLLLLKE